MPSPRDVSLGLPSGQQIVLPADHVSVRQRDSLLAGVQIPPGGGASDHPKAVARTQALLASNPPLRRRPGARSLAGWRTDDGAAQTARITTRDVEVEVALKPDTRAG